MDSATPNQTEPAGQVRQEKAIGLLGGTFDPVHFGHLNMAWQALEKLDLDEIWFIPCHVPAHKKPTCSPETRIEMLSLATAAQPCFQINTIEIERSEESFTVNTLKALRRQKAETDFFYFLMGEDSFYSLNTWNNWQQLIQYAHLIVCSRPFDQKQRPESLPVDIETFQKQHLTDSTQTLKSAVGRDRGSIFTLDIPPLGISSSAIRQCIEEGHQPAFLVPDAVLDFIKKRKVY